MMFPRKTFAVLLVMVAAGCAGGHYPGVEVESAWGLTVAGSSFDRVLFAKYIMRADIENAENDYFNSDLFARKAKAIAAGRLVLPESVDAHNILADKVAEFRSARERLIRSLDAGGRANMPEAAATAQLKFDCWVEEQEENIQPQDIAACRKAFEGALGRFEVAEAAPAAPPPEPRPMPSTYTYIVYFDFDSADVDRGGRLIIDSVIEDFRNSGSSAITVFGHADRSGNAAYNDALAMHRAQAVRGALIKGGIDPAAIGTKDYGEHAPIFETGDGVGHPFNRRVEITIIR